MVAGEVEWKARGKEREKGRLERKEGRKGGGSEKEREKGGVETKKGRKVGYREGKKRSKNG